jgi:hypothetical protein
MKLFLTTTSLFEQINPNSLDGITSLGKFPLKQGLSDVSVDRNSRVTTAFSGIRCQESEILNFRTKTLFLTVQPIHAT